MTDNEIIKALECCGIEQNCKWCPYNGTDVSPKMYCQDKKDIDARDLINRQKAEIEKKDVEIDILIRKKETLKDEGSELKAEVERLQKANESFSCLGMLYSEIKSEARKEFWEQIKAMYGLDENDIIVAVNIKEIDNLLAEMESEGK